MNHPSRLATQLIQGPSFAQNRETRAILDIGGEHLAQLLRGLAKIKHEKVGDGVVALDDVRGLLRRGVELDPHEERSQTVGLKLLKLTTSQKKKKMKRESQTYLLLDRVERTLVAAALARRMKEFLELEALLDELSAEGSALRAGASQRAACDGACEATHRPAKRKEKEEGRFELRSRVTLYLYPHGRHPPQLNGGRSRLSSLVGADFSGEPPLRLLEFDV